VANGKIVRATSNKQVIFYANHACVPNADPCGAHDCGIASDGCGKTVACGTCTIGEKCEFGFCQEKTPTCKPPLHWCPDMGCARFCE
jgi:hypothetical protein